MSDATLQQPAADPPRSSRQELVLPPKTSNWPVIAGAVASGLVGFGLVFSLGIGRSRHPAHAPEPAPVVAVAAPAVSEPAPLEAVEPRANPTRWSPPPEADFQAADLPPPPQRFAQPGSDPADRYAERMVSHEAPPPISETVASPSRFASPDLPPFDAPASAVPAADVAASLPQPPPDHDPERGRVSAGMPTHEPESVRETQGGSEPPIDPEPPTELETQTMSDTRAGRESESDAAPPAFEPAFTSSAPPSVAGAAMPDLTGASQHQPMNEAGEPAAVSVDAVAVEASTAAERGAEVPARSTELPPVAAPANPFARVAEPAPAAVPSPLPSEGAAAVSNTSEPATRFGRAPIAPVAATQDEPPPPRVAPAAVPFAAAPPLGPAPRESFGGDSGWSPDQAGSAPAVEREPMPATGLTGQGVPGPLQLEGVQTPQLAVEKRGPKEIQVGKPARYEILVRNVGSATAHDIQLRDAVPRGTSLIATTPPAAPAVDRADAAGDLVWTLGVLPPGGEVRVLMELMPEEEGEIGSIASVSFRADATLRSRSTKPALAIDCPEPEPVRIGSDMQVALTISNPGSGTATGVVLEAFLPETVSHRSGSELEFDVGQLRPGEAKTIDLVLGTRGPGLQPARLIARADGGIEELLQVPLEVTAPTIELAIDMPARRFLQRPATCRIAMVNAGTASARAVELAVQLPPGMKFVRANNAGWHDERTHRVLWNLEELPAGETGTVEAVIMPVQPGPQRITAAARSTDGPSAQVDHLCQVEGLAALSFQVLDSEDPIEVEGLTEYVIRVSNDGTKAASGVRVAATLLGDLEPVEANGPGGHRVENLAVEFEPLAKLGPGEEAVYRVRARGRRAGDHRVQVQLVSDDHTTPITKEEITRVYDDR